jgi:acyl dehydratase
MTEKPVLTIERLKAGVPLEPLTLPITEEFLAAYHRAIGEEPIYLEGRQVAPGGIAGIWGRRAYLVNHRMPGGSVLFQLEYEFKRPLFLGDTLIAQARVKEISDRKGRPLVRMRIEGKNQKGESVGAVELAVLWSK